MVPHTGGPAECDSRYRSGGPVHGPADARDGLGQRGDRGVDDDLGARRRLVRVVDAGEPGDLPGAGPRVQALDVAALADLQRRGQVHQHEPAVPLDQRTGLLTRGLVGRDRRHHHGAAVLDHLAGDEADPADVEVAVLAGEGELAGQVGADDVAVEHRHRLAVPLQVGDQRVGDRGLAGTGEPGEEHGDARVRLSWHAASLAQRLATPPSRPRLAGCPRDRPVEDSAACLPAFGGVGGVPERPPRLLQRDEIGDLRRERARDHVGEGDPFEHAPVGLPRGHPDRGQRDRGARVLDVLRTLAVHLGEEALLHAHHPGDGDLRGRQGQAVAALAAALAGDQPGVLEVAEDQVDWATALPRPLGWVVDPLLRRRVRRAMRAHLDGYAAAAARRALDVVQVVGAALVDGDRVLVAQRSGGSYDGCWEFPGGKVEPGAEELAALVREIGEELGVTVVPHAFLGEVVLDGVVAGGLPGASTLRVWWGRVRPGGEVTAHEHSELRWLTADELESLDWIPADRPLLPAVRALLARLRGDRP